VLVGFVGNGGADGICIGVLVTKNEDRVGHY
jgi:hypothetical protein